MLPENHHHRKHLEERNRNILAAHARGMPREQISRIYGVAPGTIKLIVAHSRNPDIPLHQLAWGDAQTKG